MPATASSSMQTSGITPVLHGKGLVRKLARVLRLWTFRRRTRRALLTLTDAQCADIGRSRAEVLAEAQRPFWRG